MDSTEDGPHHRRQRHFFRTENAMQQSTSFIKGKTALPAVTRKSAGTYMNVVSGLVHQNKENIAEQNGKSHNQQFKTLGELDLNRPTPSQLRKSQTPIPVETSVSKACQTQLPPRDFQLAHALQPPMWNLVWWFYPKSFTTICGGSWEKTSSAYQPTILRPLCYGQPGEHYQWHNNNWTGKEGTG